MVYLYPPFKVKGQSFEGVKRCTVPNQSMSLREIVRRFVRREALPTFKEGTYEERFGDLEKLSHADITEKMDKVEELKQQIAAFNEREQKRAAKLKAEKEAAEKLAFDKAVQSATTTPTEGGGGPIKSPPPKGA